MSSSVAELMQRALTGSENGKLQLTAMTLTGTGLTPKIYRHLSISVPHLQKRSDYSNLSC